MPAPSRTNAQHLRAFHRALGLTPPDRPTVPDAALLTLRRTLIHEEWHEVQAEFATLTDGSHERLYRLKGEVVARGVKAVTGLEMPVFEKRRFQHGAADRKWFGEAFPSQPSAYRRVFHALYE